MQDFEFYSPTKIYFGKKKETLVGSIIKQYGFKKVLVVCGMSSIKKSGLYDVVLESLKNENIEYFILDNVEPNPKLNLVKKGTLITKTNNVDFILAVGGGSVIDTAKAIACAHYLDCDPWLLNAHKVKPVNALPVGTILTISAAGSELSNSCVITNEELKIKSGFNTDLIRPLFSILNPELTYTVSSYQTACGIVDMIMHTLERYLTDVDNLYFEEEVAIGLIKSIIKAGRLALKNPFDFDARATLMLASSFSHNGLTGLGGKFYFTVHKLEHELSGRFDHILHAAGLSILYAGWAKEVYQKLPKKFAYFARSVFNISDDDDLSCALKGINMLKAFFEEIKMPTSLKEVGVSEDFIEPMAQRITNNGTVKVVGFLELDYQLVLNILNNIK